jgi:saccharopine dehydrogenase-like NADP-dependent oxidoreductase
MEKTKVAIFGAGQIGRAIFQILTDLSKNAFLQNGSPYADLSAFVIDCSKENVSKIGYGDHVISDLSTDSVTEITRILASNGTTHVINALPFSLNEKIAAATLEARCHYIDFTEDDIMADTVQGIFKDSDLTCAVKCGLAPGFINYIGYDLVNKVKVPEELVISVGALPRTAIYADYSPAGSYNLSWSVDGLVNEYIRPCRIRADGIETEVRALDHVFNVMIDGTQYEAAHTSGGVGSLVRDLSNVPYVAYMSLRYPGHYEYVKNTVTKYRGDFDAIKAEFLRVFAFTDDDVIVVYATCSGSDGTNKIQRSYSEKFYGVDGLTAIQSTTAGSGIAMLELILEGKVGGTVNHTDIVLSDFTDTLAYRKYYNKRT